MRTNWIAIGAVLAALAVVAGAFGAHGLKERLAPDDLDVWKTAVLYHALHAIGLVAYGVFAGGNPGRTAGSCFTSGILVFCGTLYAIALGGPKWLGMVTPIGGLLLVAGWLGFAWDARRRGANS